MNRCFKICMLLLQQHKQQLQLLLRACMRAWVLA
jgi:hypothetical protein